MIPYKMRGKSEDKNIIITVSLTDYTQNRPSRYSRMPVKYVANELFKLSQNGVNTNISTYEVLKRDVRKIYFDIEKIPVDQPKLIYDMMNDINDFFKNKAGDQLTNGDMRFIITHNGDSANHDGLSYHLICYNYSMSYQNMKGIITEFVNTVGNKYFEYIDTSVYSTKRLFKLPYYIGIIKDGGLDDNINNYHYIVNLPVNPSEEFFNKCIIQYTVDTVELSIDFLTKPNYRHNTISAGPRLNKRLANQLTKKIENIECLLTRRDNEYTYKQIKDTVDKVYKFIDRLGTVSKKKVTEIKEAINDVNISNDKLQQYGALLNTICQKYKII